MIAASHWLSALLMGVLALASANAESADLQQLINEAVRTKAAALTLPPGTYRLEGSPDTNALLSIDGASDLTITAAEVHVIGTQLRYGLKLSNCENITVRGLTLDYDPLPFTQGLVEEFDQDQNIAVIKLDEGYPETAAYTRCGIYDAGTRKQKFDTAPIYSKEVKLLGQRRVQVAVTRWSAKNLARGDLFVLANPKASPHGLYLADCRGVTIEDMTIFSAPIFGIYEGGGGGDNVYRRVRITPGALPPGATATRLRSSVADGIHSSGVAKGPLIEDCLLEDMADDAIAIHGRYQVVLEQRSGSLIFTGTDKHGLQEGSRIEVVTPYGVVRGQSVVKSIRELPVYPKDRRESVLKKFLLEKQQRLYTRTWEIVLEQALTVSPGDRLSDLNRCGNGFVIRNNRINNNRARGILIKASEGLIENNTIDGSSRAGIALSPELDWNEAGYSYGVVVRNNTIRNVGREAYLLNSPQAGALTICASGGHVNSAQPESSTYAPAGGHRHIKIEGNNFEDNRAVNLLVTSAADVIVQGNTFSGTHAEPYNEQGNFGVDPNAVIWVTQTNGIRLINNRLSMPSVHTGNLLKTTDSVSRLQDMDGIAGWKPANGEKQ